MTTFEILFCSMGAGQKRGTEHLPFLRFEPNSVFYYTMLISFFLFEAFKEDVLKDAARLIEIPVNENSYATTFRRYLIDFAAKLVYTGREIILKVTGALWERVKIAILWDGGGLSLKP